MGTVVAQTVAIATFRSKCLCKGTQSSTTGGMSQNDPYYGALLLCASTLQTGKTARKGQREGMAFFPLHPVRLSVDSQTRVSHHSHEECKGVLDQESGASRAIGMSESVT